MKKSLFLSLILLTACDASLLAALPLLDAEKETAPTQSENENTTSGSTLYVPPQFQRPEAENWSLQRSGTEELLRQVDFVDSQHGWISGDNVLLRTTNAGQSWEKQALPIEAHWSGLEFIDQKQGWILSRRGQLFATQNGGQSWGPEVQIGTGSFFHCSGLQFFSATEGIAECGNELFLSQNGGRSWSSMENFPERFAPFAWHFYNRQTGVGEVYWTENGGGSFDLREAPQRPMDVQFLSASTVYAVTQTRFFRSENAGRSWQEPHAGADKPPFGGQGPELYFVNAQQGWVSVDSRIFKSEDAGDSWQRETLPSEARQDIYDLFFVNAQQGWAVGQRGQILHYQK